MHIKLMHCLATVAVAAGLLAPAASASAGVTDGTSNTIMFAERAATPEGFSIDVGTSENIAADGRGADDAQRIDLAGPFTPNNWQ